MHVGTFSGVRSPGHVISSALGGTSHGNSSDTNDKISEVLPTFLKFYFEFLSDDKQKHSKKFQYD